MREGDQFGSYLLEERIAAGGMAEIFRARRVGAAGFARQVCIKRILPQFCAEEAFVAMFIDEARTGAQLRHGNIVAIDDFGEVAGQYFLCMELVAGVDLARLLKQLERDRKALPPDAAVFVGAEVLKALDYAHRKMGADGAPLGIVHRDVSPQNVLVSFAGEVKLTDFGIAKASSRLHQTVGNVVKGKLAYMSPEQVYGHPLDGRTDLFALGVVLFEALAGRRPFAGANESELVMALLRGDRPRLRALRSDVAPALEAVVDRLLEADVARRYASAGEALEDLVRLQHGVTGSRLLAGMTEHYFPGHNAGVRGNGWFSRDLLPDASTDANAGVGAAVRGVDALAPTAMSDVLAASLATSAQGGPDAATVATARGDGLYAATTVSAPPEMRAPGDAAIPGTAVSEGTLVVPPVFAGATPPSASGTDPQRRETSAHEATRTMVRPEPGAQATPPSGAARNGATEAGTETVPPPVQPRRSGGARPPGRSGALVVAVVGAVVAVAVALVAGVYLLAGRNEHRTPPRESAPEVGAREQDHGPSGAAPATNVPLVLPSATAASDASGSAVDAAARVADAAGEARGVGAAAVAGAVAGAAVDAGASARAGGPGASDGAMSGAAPGANARREGVQRAPAADPHAPGTLTVETIPPGEATVDGEARGTTPLHLTLRPGAHTVELLWRPGHVTRARRVTVPPGGHARLSVDFRR